MRFARRAVYFTAPAALTLGLGCRPDHPPEPAGRLAEFEGVIEGGQILDHARSDLYVRAARALEAGDGDLAEALYREGVARYPADPAAYDRLGACLFFRARYPEARAEYERALALDPRSADARYGLGCVDYKESRYPEARDHLLAALAVRDGHGRTHRMLALVYDQLRDRAAARRHYERAAALDPGIAAEDHVRRRLAEGEPGVTPDRPR
jgi:tetratricopeptide (TPR) repeat protein